MTRGQSFPAAQGPVVPCRPGARGTRPPGGQGSVPYGTTGLGTPPRFSPKCKSLIEALMGRICCPAQRPEKKQGVPGTPEIHLIPPSRAGANRRSSNVGFEKSERGCLQNSILSHSSRKLPRESPRARPKRRPETPDFGPPPTRGPLAPGRIDCLGLKVPPVLSDKKSIKFSLGACVCVAWFGAKK